jgi:uncharacterized protein with FMN-binding domain
MLQTYEQNSKKKLVAMFLTVLIIAGSVIVADHLKAKNAVASSSSQTIPATTPAASNSSTIPASSATATNSSSATTNNTATPTTNASGYKNGTYTATSDYFVPHGSESIDVKLTLADGAVTDVSIQNSESDHDSARYQENFAAVYKKYVVGKKISGLQLGIVAGASDTVQGFNDALSQIASKAQV